MDDSPWLSTGQQAVWRSWLHLNAQLPAVLHRQLSEESGLSLPDFEVLVQLTDDPEGRVRVTDLSRSLNWDRSRVSHHVTRMQRRGLVRREDCTDDKRGAFVVITPAGRDAITRAAPAHARTVKDLVFADVSEAQLESVGAFIDHVMSRLAASRSGTPTGTLGPEGSHERP
jgi:DNA-binding MarR family transcriptional regulator